MAAVTKNGNRQRSALPRSAAPLAGPVSDVLESFAERKAAGSAEDFQLHPIDPVRIVAAFSGGRDSTALVDILSRMYHARHQTFISSLTVVHVNHGISEHCDEWEEHAREACARWDVPLVVERVSVSRFSSQGLEAAARLVRYRALKKVAESVGADMVMTAHHLDDRLETFLIQWMRGAGPEGLSAMTAIRPMEEDVFGSGLVLVRPWLNVSRETIESYVKRTRLRYVEDDSNADTRFLRNMIRSEVLPRLDGARPGWRRAAGRSVELVAQAADLARDVGSSDLELCRADVPHALAISGLLNLPVIRQAACIRSWLAEEGMKSPSRAKLWDILRQVRETYSDNRLAVRLESRELRRWGTNLVIVDARRQEQAAVRDMTLEWNGEDEMSLGLWAGVLRFERCAPGEEGFDAERLRREPLMVRERKGGEKIKLHPLRPSRNLKHHYQAAKIAQFERPSLPLVWLGGRLIFAAGLGAEVRELADPDLVPERIRLVWVPDRPLISL